MAVAEVVTLGFGSFASSPLLVVTLGFSVTGVTIGAARGSDARLHGAHGRTQALGVVLGSDRRLHGAHGWDEPAPLG